MLEVLGKKAKKLENRLVHTDNAGNTTNVSRLLEINETLKRPPDVRIYEIPSCKMVTSQPGMFGEGKLKEFGLWFSQFPREVFPKLV